MLNVLASQILKVCIHIHIVNTFIHAYISTFIHVRKMYYEMLNVLASQIDSFVPQDFGEVEDVMRQVFVPPPTEIPRCHDILGVMRKTPRCHATPVASHPGVFRMTPPLRRPVPSHLGVFVLPCLPFFFRGCAMNAWRVAIWHDSFICVTWLKDVTSHCHTRGKDLVHDTVWQRQARKKGEAHDCSSASL